jgi:carbon-monoxide dehydrogenase small subunit
MMQISLTVNGEPTEALVEPRTHLADFLREQCHLTGTHLGCEHGVCGACTVLLDGAPVRSCITYAVACEGAVVRTVEGFAEDATMARLRAAFTEEHALQCGFCTPGMLIASHDIVTRLEGATEAEIRTELSGNLCRCTGYMGIVKAVKRVAAEAPAGAGRAMPILTAPPIVAAPATPAAGVFITKALAPENAGPEKAAPEAGWTRVTDGFMVARPPAVVWRLFADVPRVAGCMPGAALEGIEGDTLRGRFKVRLGPIATSFTGVATLERDDDRLLGRLAGGGKDEKSGSRASGRVSYHLTPSGGGGTTRVDVTLDFRLQGMLAQFGRSGLVRDLIGRMVADFAANLARVAESGEEQTSAPAAEELRASRLIGLVLWARVKHFFVALFGKGVA